MEFISVTDTNNHVSGIILVGEAVMVMSPLLSQAEFSLKEFDRFVAAYRKARRMYTKVVPETPAE